jgi:cytochrome P450
VFGVAWYTYFAFITVVPSLKYPPRAMLHDPSVYDKPEDFLPERFLRRTPSGVWELDPTAQDPRTIAFGFGRRICPGQHLAEQSLFATIATVLAAVDVLPALDENGKDVIPPISLVKGTVSYVNLQDLPTIIFRH